MLNTCADGRGLTRAVNNLFTDTVQLYRMLVYRYNSTSTDTGSEPPNVLVHRYNSTDTVPGPRCERQTSTMRKLLHRSGCVSRARWLVGRSDRKYPTKGVHPPTSVQIPHSEKRPNGNSSAKAEMGHSWRWTLVGRYFLAVLLTHKYSVAQHRLRLRRPARTSKIHLRIVVVQWRCAAAAPRRGRVCIKCSIYSHWYNIIIRYGDYQISINHGIVNIIIIMVSHVMWRR